MITIRKGKKKLKVSESAFKNFYKNAGWEEEGKVAKKHSSKDESKFPVVEEEILISEDPEVSEEGTDEDWDADEDEEPTKPLSEMNRDELVETAKKLDVSLAGLSTNKQIREAIRAAM